MRVLMLNAYFIPEQTAFTHLEQDLLDAFAAENFMVNVVTPVPTRGVDGKVRKEYAGKREEYLYDGAVCVQRFWAPREGRNPVTRAFRYFWCNLREYQMGRKYGDTDVIFCTSTPPTQGWMAALVKKSIKKHGNQQVKLIYNLQDIFPDSMVNAGMTRKGSFLWKIGRRIEDKTYENADKIIAISDNFKRNILKKGAEEKKITVIPNWVDSNAVIPVSRENNTLFEKYNLNPSKFYICYSGNIGHSQNISLLIEVFVRTRNVLPDVVFVVIGEGAAKPELEQFVSNNRIENIIVLPFQPPGDISNVYSMGDIDLIISKKGIGSSSVPSKTWSIMSSGRPILASFDSESELGELIRESNCGIVVEPDDIDGFISAIKELYENKDVRLKMGRNGRDFVRRYRDKSACTKEYVAVLKSK